MNIPSDKATIGRIVIIKISSLLDALACSSQQSMLEKHIYLTGINVKQYPIKKGNPNAITNYINECLSYNFRLLDNQKQIKGIYTIQINFTEKCYKLKSYIVMAYCNGTV